MVIGSVSAPSFLLRTMPVYPTIARRFGKEGTVVLRLSIDEKGRLTGVEVLQDPGYGFANAAIESVKKSRFAPARSHGVPTSARALLSVRFVLRGM